MKTMEERIAALPKMRPKGNELDGIVSLIPPGGIVAELGCFAGEGTAQFLACPRVARLVCVDMWRGGYDPADWASVADMVAARESWNRARGEPSGRCYAFTLPIVKAALYYDPSIFDLVYLDADHRYESVKADIMAWRPLVKPGGWFCGHDYGEPAHPGVRRAVDEIFGRPHRTFPDSSWAVRL